MLRIEEPWWIITRVVMFKSWNTLTDQNKNWIVNPILFLKSLSKLARSMLNQFSKPPKMLFSEKSSASAADKKWVSSTRFMPIKLRTHRVIFWIPKIKTTPLSWFCPTTSPLVSYLTLVDILFSLLSNLFLLL